MNVAAVAQMFMNMSDGSAVASSPDEEQLAMSPAPTITTPGGGLAVTVIAAEPLTFPSLAVTVALQAAIPVTRPDADTVATAALDEAHPITAVALDGDTVAESCTVWPMTIVALAGETRIDLTFGPALPLASIGSVGITDVGADL